MMGWAQRVVGVCYAEGEIPAGCQDGSCLRGRNCNAQSLVFSRYLIDILEGDGHDWDLAPEICIGQGDVLDALELLWRYSIG